MEIKPVWIKKSIDPSSENLEKVKNILDAYCLNTVCQSAECPNIFECFSKKTATFMILGNTCTRNCSFCAVNKGIPAPIDLNEPQNIAKAVTEMGLKYVVITSVTRDDLKDGGAVHFVKVIKEIKKKSPDVKIEVLIPDFKGNKESLKKVVSEDIFVLNHNIETIEKKYPSIRAMAKYDRSLALLDTAKKERPDIYVKSGFMLGFSETEEDIKKLLKDLKEHSCDIVTIGQYLRPSKENIAVKKYYTPKEFKKIKAFAESLHFKSIACDVFVRSSYMAANLI